MPTIRTTRHCLNKLFIAGTLTFALMYLLLQTSTVRQGASSSWDTGQESFATRYPTGNMTNLAGAEQVKTKGAVKISVVQKKEAEQALHEAGIIVRKTTASHKSGAKTIAAMNSTPQPIVNPHPFHYVIHPGNVCSNGDMYLFVYVHSAPTHYKHRLLIRQTWGNSKQYLPTKVKVVFILGLSQSSQTNSAVHYESDMYGDIVQENFMDAYKNLTYKGVAGLRYVSMNCQNVNYVMKTDDDVVVNTYALLRQLKDMKKDKLIMCLTWYHMKVMREPHNKWYVSKKEWAPDEYPPYCSGSAFIYTPDIATATLAHAPYTPYFWVDDLYVTGMLVNKLGIKHVNIRPRYELNLDKFENFYNSDKVGGLEKMLMFTHARGLPISRLYRLWEKIQRIGQAETGWRVAAAA